MGNKNEVCVACNTSGSISPQWGHASNNVLLPGPKISFSMKDALMKDVIWELEKRSGFVFAYNANDLLKAGESERGGEGQGCL